MHACMQVNKAFSERRKMLRNTLAPLYSREQAEAALGALGLRPDARAQDLSLEQFVALAWQLHGQDAAAAAEGLGAADSDAIDSDAAV